MNNKKVLVLGSTGMLGHQIYSYFKVSEGFEVFDLSFRNKLNPDTIICDVTDTDRLLGIIQDIKPNFIINCIGILIRGSNQNPQNAIFINSYFPHWLVSNSESLGIKVIHISTDCVFSGIRGEYVESDIRDADDVYGRSKALGEIYSNKHLTIRTSIIGHELKKDGEGLLQWFLQQNDKVYGYTNAFWGGVTTLELSKIIVELIKQKITGIIHITNGKKISKYELLNLFNIYSKKNLIIIPSNNKKIDKSLKTLNKEFVYNIPSYEQMIAEMFNL